MENKVSYELLEKAIKIAVSAHAGQKDKNGMPYILHPLRVMFSGKNSDEKICGILHDTIEDTHVTADFLANEGFPNYLIDAVLAVTKHENESYEDFINKAKQNPIAKQVKIYDLIDNLDVKRLDSVKDTDLDRFNKYLQALQVLQNDYHKCIR